MINKLLLFHFLTVFLFIGACQHYSGNYNSDEINTVAISNTEIRDTSLFYFNSMQITNFLNRHPKEKNQREKIDLFYKKRNYAFAWINSEGFNEFAGNFINMLNNEKIMSRNDSVFYHDILHSMYTILSEEDNKFRNKDSLVLEMELLLTVNFFNYANRNWKGISDEGLKNVKWFIERKKINYTELLDTMLKSNNQSISALIPLHPQYTLLKKHLKEYMEIEKKGGWNLKRDKINFLKRGDTSLVIYSIKNQLFVMKDLKINDSTTIFNEAMEVAVKKFQKRHGLNDDGVIGKKTFHELSIPVEDRIRQILINMERIRWVPTQMKGNYLIINIPDFKLFVYNDNLLEWTCKVIVGKTKLIYNTVIFNEELEYIVFSPYWNIPKNILVKEILPAVKKNPNYLMRNDMEIVTMEGRQIAATSIEWNKYKSNFPYVIRQKPGENNALGLVKFLFPNPYSIYLHDTPTKHLFGETNRTFSHGCIRMEKPFKFAQFLLREDTSWTDSKINLLMHGGNQTYVKLKNKVPVFITYFTAWADINGVLNFRNDIYNHDKKMEKLLFAN